MTDKDQKRPIGRGRGRAVNVGAGPWHRSLRPRRVETPATAEVKQQQIRPAEKTLDSNKNLQDVKCANSNKTQVNAGLTASCNKNEVPKPESTQNKPSKSDKFEEAKPAAICNNTENEKCVKKISPESTQNKPSKSDKFEEAKPAAICNNTEKEKCVKKISPDMSSLSVEAKEFYPRGYQPNNVNAEGFHPTSAGACALQPTQKLTYYNGHQANSRNLNNQTYSQDESPLLTSFKNWINSQKYQGSEHRVDILKIEAFELVNFTADYIIQYPDLFTSIMDMAGPEFLIYLPYEEAMAMIVRRLYTKTILKPCFAFHALRILTGLVDLEMALFQTAKTRDYILQFIRKKVNEMVEDLDSKRGTTVKFLQLSFFTSELYLQLKVGTGRLKVIGIAILELMEAYIKAPNLDRKDRFTNCKNLFKLIGFALDKDTPTALNHFIEVLETEMNKGGIDDHTLSLVKNIIDLRSSGWGASSEDAEEASTSSDTKASQESHALVTASHQPQQVEGVQPYPPIQQVEGVQPYPSIQQVEEVQPYPPIQQVEGVQPYPPIQQVEGLAPYPPAHQVEGVQPIPPHAVQEPIGNDQLFQGDESQHVIPLFNNLTLMPGLTLSANLNYPRQPDEGYEPYQYGQPINNTFMNVNPMAQFMPFQGQYVPMAESAAVLYAPDGSIMAPEEELFLQNNMNNEYPSPSESPFRCSASPGVDEAYAEFIKNLPSAHNRYNKK